MFRNSQMLLVLLHIHAGAQPLKNRTIEENRENRHIRRYVFLFNRLIEIDAMQTERSSSAAYENNSFD